MPVKIYGYQMCLKFWDISALQEYLC